MIKSIRLANLQLIIPLILILGLVGFSSNFPTSLRLSNAIIFDFLITVPFIYFLIIRKRKIPKTTIVPVFILGVILSSIFIPLEHQQYLSLIKQWLVPMLEITIVAFTIYKVRVLVKKVKKEKRTNLDFHAAIKQATNEILPSRLSTVMATEISVFYYGFISWKRRKLSSNEFSYHRTSSTVLTFSVFIFLIIVETFVFHLLIQSWSTVFAWILTGLSAYSAVQLLGIIKSLSRRPVLIKENQIILRYGLLGETNIEIDNLAKVVQSSKEMKFSKEFRALSPLNSMEGHNIILKLYKPTSLTGFYGIQKSYSSIAFYVDEPDRLAERLDQLLSSKNN